MLTWMPPMSELSLHDELDINPASDLDRMTLPADPVALKTAALLLQNDLAYERQQRLSTEEKLRSLESESCQDSSSSLNKPRFEEQRAHYLELIQHGKTQLRQCKEQQRKWEAEMLHRIEKLKTERSTVTERCLLLERSNAQLQHDVSSLQSQIATLRLQLTQTEEALVLTKHEISKQASQLECSSIKISTLNDELSRERVLCKQLSTEASLARPDSFQRLEPCEELVQSAQRGLRAEAKIQSLQKEVDTLKNECKDRDCVVVELKQTLILQREFTAVQMTSLGERCESLKNLNYLLRNQLLSLQLASNQSVTNQSE